MKLQSFPTIIPALQSSKVLELLEDQRKTGEIETELEFNQALQTALLNLDSSDGVFKPITTSLFIKQGLSSSEVFNFQLSQLKRDMDVIALELANIGSVVKAHSEIFQDKYIDQIKFSVNDLNSKIENLQIIKNSSIGYENFIANIFVDLGDLLNKNTSLAEDLYQDLRRFIFIPDNEIAFLDRESESLTLPLSDNTEIPFLKVTVDLTNTTISEIDINVADSMPKNILDNEIGTFWFQNTLKSNILSEGAKLTLDFDLGDKKDINFFVVQSVADFPMFIEDISYVDEFDSIQDLPVDLSEQILHGSRKFAFETLVAQRIILKLKQFNTSSISVNLNHPEITLDDIKRNTQLEPTIDILTESVNDNLTDPAIRDGLMLSDPLEQNFKIFYNYVFALDNAFVGRDNYIDNGFFISKAKEISRLSQISLDISETIPTFLNEELEALFNSGSIEYSLIKRDFNGKRDFIGISVLPILPLGTFSITNERLFFTPLRTIVDLRFTGHTTSQDASNVVVYRNNVELVRGTDWRFSNRSNPGDDTDFLITPNDKTTSIEILHDNNLISNGIYTVDYVPQHLSNPETIYYYDNQNTILFLPNNNIEFRIDKLFDPPEMSELYLKIALRNNSFLDFLTPRLNFYKLFYSSL